MRLTWSEKKLEEDNLAEVCEDKRTMDLVAEIANTLMAGFWFTTDVPSQYVSGKVPMLDLAVWLDKGAQDSTQDDKRKFDIVRHTFYQKPTMSP